MCHEIFEIHFFHDDFPDGVKSWKKWRSKISWHTPFKLINQQIIFPLLVTKLINQQIVFLLLDTKLINQQIDNPF